MRDIKNLFYKESVESIEEIAPNQWRLTLLDTKTHYNEGISIPVYIGIATYRPADESWRFCTPDETQAEPEDDAHWDFGEALRWTLYKAYDDPDCSDGMKWYDVAYDAPWHHGW